MKKRRLLILAFLVLVMGLAAVPVLAADEGPSQFRRIWDAVWLFINFGILMFFLIKYGREPIMRFLDNHKDEIGNNLKQNEELLAQAEAEYEESQTRYAQLDQRITELEEQRNNEARIARERILREAEETSAKILDEARGMAESEMKKAWISAKVELVEMAMEEAEKLIRESISREDEERIIKEYMDRLSAEL